MTVQGKVTSITRATNSQFSMIPSDGVSGTFVKVAQRVPLRVDLVRMPPVALSPGLSVEISIDTRGGAHSRTLADRHE